MVYSIGHDTKLNATDRLFAVCVRFLNALGRCTRLSYKQISVVFNIWLQGIVLLAASVAPLIAAIAAGCKVAVVMPIAVYAATCTTAVIGIMHRYSGSMDDAFDRCATDLLNIAGRCHCSYNCINIILFVVAFLLLIVLDAIITYILI